MSILFYIAAFLLILAIIWPRIVDHFDLHHDPDRGWYIGKRDEGDHGK